jgi:hypothetical protein
MQKLFRCLLSAVAIAGVAAPGYAQPPVPQDPPNVIQGPPEGQGPPESQSPPESEGPPDVTQGPPGAMQGPPDATQGPPDATPGPPGATQGPPDATQGPPGASQGPPDASPAATQPAPGGQRLTVKIGGGRATVIAKNVPLRDILAEWARVGTTRIVNGEKLVGAPISIELVDAPEKEVLDILLRSAAGYMTGPRPVGVAGASMYDRVMILATSRPPANTGLANAPQPFRTAIPMQQQQPPPDDDEGEPSDQGPMPPGMQFPGGPNGQPQGMPTPGQMPPGAMPPGAQMPPGAMPPGAIGPNGMPVQAPTTAPRPGMIPQQPGQNNPYSPIGRPPGAPPPGGGPDDR